MAFQYHPLLYGQVTITASPTLIAALNYSSVGTLITNSGASTVYIGDVNVTVSNGYPLAAGASVAVPSTAAIYGVSQSSGTVGYITCQ